MKKILFILSLILLYNAYCQAQPSQYVVKSQNILNPSINIDYVRNNAEFWIAHAYDPTNGGFFSNISRNGTVLNSVQANIASKSYYEKSFISQTRQAYGFTRAFMLTGDDKYLTYAKSALDFLTNHAWDTVNDGWYTFGKSDGSIDNDRWWNPNTGKWGFTQQYAIVGIMANYEATHDPTTKAWIDKAENSINNHMWDSRPGYEGYYEQANLNWSGLTGKGFGCTVDAITTHAELSYLVTQDSARKAKLEQLANIIITRFIPQMDNPNVKVLYPEGYDNNWVCNSYNTDGSIGHFIKTSWVLGRAYLCDTTKKELKNAASKILNEAWTYQNGAVSIWDHVNGGPFNSINIGTGNWGTNYGTPVGDNKDYWTVEQGFTGPMINYYITKNPIYLQMADEAISFYMSHFIDQTYGETFSELDPTGTVLRSDVKGDDFKANYHGTEFGYYAYLYSNLYYLHQPATLYYKFAASPSAQTIQLTPIPMEDGLLRIQSVTLDGVNFTTFDPVSRTLNIAANQGGKFKVTFESLGVSTALTTPECNQISIYPNPVVDNFRIDGMQNVKNVSVVDLTGNVLFETNVQGQSTANLSMRQLNSGVYFVILHKNTGEQLTKKIIKQ